MRALTPSAYVDRLWHLPQRVVGLRRLTSSRMMWDQRRAAGPIQMRHFREQRIAICERAAVLAGAPYSTYRLRPSYGSRTTLKDGVSFIADGARSA